MKHAVPQAKERVIINAYALGHYLVLCRGWQGLFYPCVQHWTNSEAYYALFLLSSEVSGIVLSKE